MTISVIKFEKHHLNDLKNWAYHDDIRFQHYDFRNFKDGDYLRWYSRKQRLFSKRLFAVLKDDTVVGFITMKSINWIKKTAIMGIVFDPAELSKGYGTKAIKLFLDYFFTHINFTKLYLKVSDFNRRALKSYLKCGFKKITTQKEAFETQQNAFELLLKYKNIFSIEDKKLMCLVHTMIITQQ